MSILAIRPKDECRWDLVALGEVMLRLDPVEGRVATSRSFRVCEGGGEYNVARGLRRCFGLRTTVVSALADNPVGRLIEDLILQGGVDQSHLRWVPYDGVGHQVRNGLNFTERGFGVRAALGCSDRAHSAASQLRPGTVDWEQIFAVEGARWFHCGGVFAALSESTADVLLDAISVARRYGTIVSYDVNFRPSLWQARGGTEHAAAVNGRIAEQVDVLLGNEEDFAVGLGFPLDGVDPDLLELHPEDYEHLFGVMLARYNQLSIVTATLRQARTATVNDWGAACRTRAGFHAAPPIVGLEILDRVGGGDSFASGFVYGLMSGAEPDVALRYGVAHGALAMTTPGDTSMATLAEVERLMRGSSARVQR